MSQINKITSLTDHELREALKEYDQKPGPITDSTRNLYRKKLASLMEQAGFANSPRAKVDVESNFNNDDDDDTSDEDYIAHEEEEDDDISDEDDEDEDFDEDNGELMNELYEDIKLSSTTGEGDNLTTSMIGPDAAPNRISRYILTILVSFFVAIFSFYLYSSNNYKLLIPPQPFKNITRQLLVLLALSPIGYIAYKTVRFFRARHHKEMQRVCGLVNEALELLQSPDNPKGLMPILHIRDTLLTPAERKAKNTIKIWKKAVEFIEQHESRVKVELVNIDGEDFRAWKWIGSRKV